MMYLAILFLYLTIVSGSISDEDVVENMTSEEIRQMFHTDFVPKHEFVKVYFSERSQKRDLPAGSKMRIKAFGENINMWLYPGNSVLAGQNTPVYNAKYSQDKPANVQFLRWNGSMEMVERIYENPRWRASFIIGTEESGNAHVNGYIGSRKLAVRSLPTRVAENYRIRRRSIGDFDEVDLPLHIVFQFTENHEENLSTQPIDVTALRQRITRSNNRCIPNTLYPEVLIVVENSVYRPYEGDMYGILQYVLAFVNGIDLKFRSIENPKIRFHISGIVVAEDSKATPYISNNSLGTDVFNSSQAMRDATKFFYAVKDTFPLGSYDIALTMTRQKFGVNKRARVEGQAYVGTVCQRKDDLKIVTSVTIIKDNGAFSGVHIAAHEIGHLVGALHDDNITGADCSYRNGYLMSYKVWHTKNSADFSTCSIDAIYNSLQKTKLDCLFNLPPSAGKRLREFIPGQIKNLDQQCKSVNRKTSCQNPNGPTDICLHIYCKDENDICMRTRTAAVDGTTCGDGKFCLHMQCVSL